MIKSKKGSAVSESTMNIILWSIFFLIIFIAILALVNSDGMKNLMQLFGW